MITTLQCQKNIIASSHDKHNSIKHTFYTPKPSVEENKIKNNKQQTKHILKNTRYLLREREWGGGYWRWKTMQKSTKKKNEHIPKLEQATVPSLAYVSLGPSLPPSLPIIISQADWSTFREDETRRMLLQPIQHEKKARCVPSSARNQRRATQRLKPNV